MRFLERLQYCVSLAYYLLFFFPEDYRSEQSKLPLLGILTALALIGHYFEGTRMHQFPYLIGLIIHTSVAWVTQVSTRQTISIISLIFLSVSIGLLIAFGDSDFSRMQLKGPYQVGHKDYRTIKLGSEVSIYYPVDQDEYKKVIKRNGGNTMWLRHGDHTLLGLAKASVPYGREDHPRLCWFRYFRRIKMDTATDAEISKDFKSKKDDKNVMEVEQENQSSLVPIIFSHGLSSNRTLHSGTCRDLASFGYIVFSLDHMDLTSSYFEGQDGKGAYYCNRRDSHDLQFRQSQLDQRVKEVRALIDEISQQNFLQKAGFPDGVTLNLDKLIMSGHSFGGMTAIDSSLNEPERIKACLTLDPWLYCRYADIQAHRYPISQPLIAVSSEEFHPFCENWFESWKTLKQLQTTCATDTWKQEHVVVKKTGHLHQCDCSVVGPLEVFLKAQSRPQLTTISTYFLMSHLWMDYLDRIGQGNHIGLDKIRAFIKKMEKEWVEFDVKYTPEIEALTLNNQRKNQEDLENQKTSSNGPYQPPQIVSQRQSQYSESQILDSERIKIPIIQSLEIALNEDAMIGRLNHYGTNSNDNRI